MTNPHQDIQDYSDESLESLTLLEIMAAHSNDIRADRITLEMTQDLPSAVVLSRIIYWFSPSKKDGQKRTRIRKEGKCWIAKGDEDWWEECGVTAKQMKRIKRLLITLGVVDVKVFKFDGNPTTHYSLNIETYAKKYKKTAQKMVKKKISISTKGTEPNVPKVQKEPYQRDETITEELNKKTKSYESDKNTGSAVDARTLSLLQRKCLEEAFQSQANALCWLMNLGITEKKATTCLKNELVELRAAADYLLVYVEKNQGKKSVNAPGYYLKIVEKKWYLQRRL